MSSRRVADVLSVKPCNTLATIFAKTVTQISVEKVIATDVLAALVIVTMRRTDQEIHTLVVEEHGVTAYYQDYKSRRSRMTMYCSLSREDYDRMRDDSKIEVRV